MKIREKVLLQRDKVYQENEEEVRKRWHFEDAVGLVHLSSPFILSLLRFVVFFSLPFSLALL